MRIVFDIEGNNLLNHESVDYTSIPYKLKEDYKVHCIVAKDIDTRVVYAFYDGEYIPFEDIQYERHELKDWRDFLKGVTQVVGHNIIDYDLPVLELYFGIQYEIGPDMLDGRSVRIDDTLVLSKLLNPDRFGGHSLDSWGRRVGLDKIKFGDGSEEQWETFTPEMLRYCIRDVEVNTRTLEALRKEWGNWKWNDAYQLEKKVAEIIFRQKHFGFFFDVELGEWCYSDLVEKMTDIEKRVEPLLPEKPISKTNAKEYCPPKQQFKKDGTLSSHMERFLEKHCGEVTEFDTAVKGVRKQVEIIQPKQVKLYGKLFNLPMDPEVPVVDKEPMNLSHQTEIKQHLMGVGWVPTVWKEKDLTLDSSKRKLSKEKFEQAVERYVESTLGSPFEEARAEKLNCDPRELRRKLLDHNTSKPLKVYTSPSFTVDQEKNLCPNLIGLGEKVEYVKEIVDWLTYRHRRNAIYSPAELSASKNKDTGWLTNPRLGIDGRIPTPADTNGCNTARFQHRDVANVPRCSSLYGEHMRALFGAGPGYKQIGYDADGLEARIEGHYTIRYPGGKKYAESLVAEKPNDVHCYDEETEILTPKGWKTFGELTSEDKVAQWDKDGNISFVIPDEIVWQRYSGEMVEIKNGRMHQVVTPNHRVLTKHYTKDEWEVTEAAEYNFKSQRILPVNGLLIGNGEDMDVNFLKLLVAIQADGSFAKDCSAVQFSFTKDRKVKRLKDILNSLSAEFSERVYERKGRLEYCIRLSSGQLCASIRKLLGENKEFLWRSMLQLSPSSMEVVLDEIAHWDGTTRNNGDIVLDTTCEKTCDVIQTMAHLCNKKAYRKKYTKKTTYGVCTINRVYISNKKTNVCLENKYFSTKQYEGYIGCVVVPSTFVVVRRSGFVFVSGNTQTKNKIIDITGIKDFTRDSAKTVKYACAYGAQPPKLASQNGWPMDIAKAVFNGYWEAAAPLASLKKAVTKYWETTGEKKFIIGLDGRKLLTRSKHSLVNILFQSAGVICMKRAMVVLDGWLKEEDLTINVFRDTIEGKEYTLQMIAYHDEGQNAVTEGLVKTKTFESEEEAKEWKARQERQTGKLLSDVGKLNGKYFVAYSRVGELAAKSVTAGGEYYKLKVPLTAGYMVGNNWADTH